MTDYDLDPIADYYQPLQPYTIPPESFESVTIEMPKVFKRKAETPSKPAKKPFKKSPNYGLVEWDVALELFANGDYARSQDVTKKTFKIKDFWEKVRKLLNRDSYEGVRKAFVRGPQA